jgi:hypothetical protein
MVLVDLFHRADRGADRDVTADGDTEPGAARVPLVGQDPGTRREPPARDVDDVNGLVVHVHSPQNRVLAAPGAGACRHAGVLDGRFEGSHVGETPERGKHTRCARAAR